MGKRGIIELSRSTNAETHYNEGKDSHTYPHLFEAISAGCLQRIANAQESMAQNLKSIARNVAHISDKFPVTETQYGLLKQVVKLSARLKTAGLDGDPKSDNRGRPRRNG
jgi:hypothetical protein